MGNQGKNLTNNEDNRVGQSSHHTNAELAITELANLVSMEESIKQVLKQLKNSNVYSVGIVGDNGAGKTTLAKEVGKRVMKLEPKLFNRVIFVTVSKRGNVKRIQDRIAEALGLNLEPKDPKKRARQIVERLRIEGGILIILDDIWDWVRIDLAEVGLPGSDNHRGCKLLLTTCTASLIQNMEYNPYHIHRLKNTDPWSLFYKWAAADLKNNVPLPPKIRELSQKFVKECRGLPVHLVVAGGCLRSKKTIDKWEDAINKIRRDSEWSRDRGYHRIRVLVKWSYKELSSIVSKALLLITCLFPENEILLIEDLSNYAITIRLCSAKNEVNAAINELICSGLLLHYEDEDVVMQGLVRDAALCIVKEEYPSHMEFITQCVERTPLSYSEFSQWKKEEFVKLLRQIFQSSLASTSTTEGSEALKKEDDESLNSEAEKLQQQLNEANEEAEKLRQQLNGVKEDAKHFKMQTELLRFNFKFKLSDFLSEALRKEEEEWDRKCAILDQQLNDIETNATTLSLQLINVTKANAATAGVSTPYADWWKLW